MGINQRFTKGCGARRCEEGVSTGFVQGINAGSR